MRVSALLSISVLALASPAKSADLGGPAYAGPGYGYAPPPVVERERIIERRYYPEPAYVVPPPPPVVAPRVYYEPPIVVRPYRQAYWYPRYGYRYGYGPRIVHGGWHRRW